MKTVPKLDDQFSLSKPKQGEARNNQSLSLFIQNFTPFLVRRVFHVSFNQGFFYFVAIIMW